ncbi:MAG TPA: TOBE domain-containing protein [Pirellulales bacterium]|nr:TOBE domain-containing protein [Pirellulales bacterium]
MKISARNVLPATVVSIKDGAVNSEVLVKLAGGEEIVSVVTKASVDHLGLAAGKQVYVVVKASNVMLAVD